MVKKTKTWIIEIDWDDFSGTEPMVDLTDVRAPWNDLSTEMLGFRLSTKID